MTSEVSCLCGSVKLALHGEPIHQFYCHCDDCQAVHGAAYIGVMLYPEDQVEHLSGETDTWVYKNNPRTRCRQCGTILYAEPPGAPWKGVKANLLPPGQFKPSHHLQCQFAVLPVVDDLPHLKGFPAMFGGSDEEMPW
ncbi:GFA family protein [Halioxenophilus sp. WMMB6]|uniref:GFA family protein n=1 Tax=Halioxenophilus sp. WMMB6 TaxID=3073815 RepID=UPI00295E69F7|nr:GFA family protein [Halioxenophilus sp. WMMB6]